MLSNSLAKDLREIVRKHNLDKICNKHEHEVVKHIMESITNYQRKHINPGNWWNQVNKNPPSPVYEKGYPSYEAVNSEQPVQERYHEFILRKLKEEKENE